MIISIDNIKSIITTGGADNLYGDVFKQLREYMSVDVEGSFWARKNSKYKWDGKRYFITEKRREMATGFLPMLLKHIDRTYPELEVTLEDDRKSLPKFTKEFISQIGNFKMEGIYDHQARIVKAFNNYIDFRGQKIYFPRGICDAATNAGKTVIMAGVKENLTTQPSMLVLIHNKQVFSELFNFFKNVYPVVGQINQKTYDPQDVTIAMIQTLYSRIDSMQVRKDLNNFRVLAIDECHRSGAKSYAKVLQYCNAGVRIGLSGTALDSGNVVNKMIAIGLTSHRLEKITKRELMDKGVSTNVEVHIHLCNTILYKPLIDYKDIQRECIYESVERASIIWKNITDGYVLAAVDKIEHGRILHKHLLSLAKGSDKIVALTHGQDPNQIEVVDAFKRGEIDILISTAILQEGVNLPLVNQTYYCGGGKSVISLKQWMGRSERLLKGKEVAYFHDFYDIGKFIRKHSEERIRAYKKEELKVVEHYDPKEVKKLKPIVIR